jgi:hypothetical protein
LSSGTGAAASGAGASANGGTGATSGAPATAGSSAASGGSAAQAGASGMSVGGFAGAGNAGTSAAGSGALVDQQGVPLAKLGDMKMGSREYLNLGDFRLLVNKWGSDELNCNTSMKVFANSDKSIGWNFDRGACGGNKQKPDYPEIEFGIHPFGTGSSLATTPSFSSTTVLPLQIKDITSASVIIDGLNADITRASTWNVDFEFWLSQKNPVTEADPGVYAELIAFWGWKDDWACDKTGTVTSGDKTYNLCHQDDNWGSGWRYYQFRASSASQTFSGKADVKAFLDYLVNTRGFSKDLWVTRIEIGSELDDNTAGMVSMKNVTFQINADSKTARFGQ